MWWCHQSARSLSYSSASGGGECQAGEGASEGARRLASCVSGRGALRLSFVPADRPLHSHPSSTRNEGQRQGRTPDTLLTKARRDPWRPQLPRGPEVYSTVRSGALPPSPDARATPLGEEPSAREFEPRESAVCVLRAATCEDAPSGTVAHVAYSLCDCGQHKPWEAALGGEAMAAAAATAAGCSVAAHPAPCASSLAPPCLWQGPLQRRRGSPA